MTTRRQIPKKVIDDLLVKSKRRCAFCYMQGDTTPKVGAIAHIEPVSRGGTNITDNLVFLCASHHAEIDRASGSTPTVAEIKAARDRLYDAISKENEGLQATGPKVFIVHGHHDEAARDELARFLTDHGLAPIVLSEQPSFGMTILEKIERNADADYAIAILSPAEASSTARQNVLLELGFFLGRLGRRRVCALVTPGMEIPSDIHGLLYVEKDDRGRWKHVLTRELTDAGVPLGMPR